MVVRFRVLLECVAQKKMLNNVTFLQCKKENTNHHWHSFIHFVKDPVGIGSLFQNESRTNKKTDTHKQKDIRFSPYFNRHEQRFIQNIIEVDTRLYFATVYELNLQSRDFYLRRQRRKQV